MSLAAAFAVVAALPGLARAELPPIPQGERITSFQSDITVRPDGTMRVTETISVIAQGISIKHGIYRDFPTTYTDKRGNRYVVGFDVVSATKDGQPEKFRVEGRSNGKRVYLGDANVTLPYGPYTYTITYETNRQLGFFPDHDELFWNVTGNGWEFPIDSARATVRLPSSIPSDSVSVLGYTGPQGSTESAYRSERNDNEIYFESTRPLGPQEGLSIVVGWPKGYVTAPTTKDKIGYFFRDNASAFAGLIGVIALSAYYFLSWSAVGRDPKKSAIVPQYEPPRGLSPAAIDYLTRMKSDSKTLSAAVLSMAVKGYGTIVETGRSYKLVKKAGASVALAPEEAAAAADMFADGDECLFRKDNYASVRDAAKSLEESLEKGYGSYFTKNVWTIVVGAVISIVIAMATAAGVPSGNAPIALFLTVWLSAWTVGTYTLGKAVVLSWKSAKSATAVAGATAVTLFGIPFFAAEIGVFILLFFTVSSIFAIVVLALIAVNILFARIMPRRSVEGRRIQDEIEGFAWFLSVTEKDRMNFHNPPERTPELFEKFLPYALALGVEQQWAEQFANVLGQIGPDGQRHYAPLWYSGTHLAAINAGAFASGLSSGLATSIASSSTAPGSSSGFGGGGGGSGGGGGGGGGGGW